MAMDFEKAMQALREEYMLALPTRVGEVEEAWNALRHEEWGHADLMPLIRMAHNLAGSGATYGAVEVGRAARQLELYLKGLATAPVPEDQARSEIELRVSALHNCLAEGTRNLAHSGTG